MEPEKNQETEGYPGSENSISRQKKKEVIRLTLSNTNEKLSKIED